MNGRESFLIQEKQESEQLRELRLFVQAPGQEEVFRREENVKHFNLGAGRHQAIVYPHAVHYRENIRQPWKDIDNTLEETINDKGRHVLRNHAGRMHVEFPLEIDDDDMVIVQCDGVRFGWRFENQMHHSKATSRSGIQLKQDRLVREAHKQNQYAAITANELQMEELFKELETEQDHRAEIINLRSENRYENVLPGVSLRYELNGSSLKEDIIIENREAFDRIAIKLPNTYQYEATPEGKLLIKEKQSGRTRFWMKTPLIYDAMEHSIRGNIRITECKAYTRLEYIIDPEFLENATYPVTIDPVMEAATAPSSVEDATLKQNSSSNRSSDEYIRCGSYDDVEYVSLLRFKKIPKLTSQDTLVSAKLHMRLNASTSSRQIGVYRVLKPWVESEVAWTNFDPYDATNISTEAVECISGSDHGNAVLKFDLTNMYRKWYNGSESSSDNYGIAFKTPNNFTGDNNYTLMYSSDKNGDYYRPTLYVNYLSHAGLESWWQYEQMAAGRAGIAYVDLFNGNMVLEHADTAMSGSRMPVSVVHYYNSCLSAENNYNCGFGWRTNYHQHIDRVTLSDTEYYVWTDGDGTEHYFKKIADTHTYPDSEGMGLELNYSYGDDGSVHYTLTDKGNNRTYFIGPDNKRAWMTGMKDACGNGISIKYTSANSGCIDKIEDGIDRVTQFEYDESGMLSCITVPDLIVEGQNTYRSIYFFYDNGRLNGIRYSELGGSSLHTAYSYDGDTALLTSALDWTGMRVDAAYVPVENLNTDIIDVDVNDADAIAQMRRVVSLESLGENGAHGAKQIFAYKDMCTEVTAVENSESDAGKKLIYQFNDSGNVICIRDELGYASFTKFDSGIANKPSEQSTLRKAVVNLLRSPDFSSNWQAFGIVEQDTSNRCLGAPLAKLVGTSFPVSYRQRIKLEKGTKYVLSSYVRTEEATGLGAYLALTNVLNESSVLRSVPLNGSTDVAVGNELPMDGWERVHLNLDLTYALNDEEYYVDLCFEGAGTAWFACPQLEKGSTLSPVNFLSNSDFRYTVNADERALPKDWVSCDNNLTTAATSAFIKEDDPMFPSALTGGYVQVEGRPNKTKVGFQQEISLKGSKNDVFVVGGWTDSQSVPNAKSASRNIALTVELKGSDGEWTDPTVCAFSSERIGWQFGCWGVIASQAYSAIRITASYSKNCGLAKFSNIFLHREQFGRSFIYDDADNVISTSTLSGQKSTIVYDTANNIRRYVQPGRADDNENYHRMSYGDTAAEQKQHLLLSHRTPMYMLDRYAYDDAGNCTTSVRLKYEDLEDSLGGLDNAFIRTETSYDANKNYSLTSTDARGNVVSKEVDSNTGLTHSITDPAGQTVHYTYDADHRIVEVETQTENNRVYRNTYAYEKDRISTISHNTTANETDVNYTFEYDELGRKTTVKIGAQSLSTNVYEDDRSGLLKEVQYGNGGKVDYEYDDFDRMTAVRWDGEENPRYTYEYGYNGQASAVYDHHLDRITRTEFDLADRPCKVEVNDGNENLLYRTQLKYDKYSNLQKFYEKLPGETHFSGYAYDRDNRITEINYDGDANKLEYDYDFLGRIRTRKAISGENTYETAYSYVPGGHGELSTTPLVATITQPGMNLAYEYDSRGNITGVTQNGQTTTYAYDALGQLIRENDPAQNATWVYEYDCGGNILSKKKYAYTTGDLGEVQQEITYGYHAFGETIEEDGRNYTWGPNKQKLFVFPPEGENHYGFLSSDGVHEDSETRLQILKAGTAMQARVMRNGYDITGILPDSAFNWQRESGNAETDAAWNAAREGKKSITLAAEDQNQRVKIRCSFTGSQTSYGSMSASLENGLLTVEHTKGVEDANDSFASNAANDLLLNRADGTGQPYKLEGGVLYGNTGFDGTITAEAKSYVPHEGDWKDLLTEYDGREIKYDAIGNPLSDGEKYYTWAGGRQLQSISIPLDEPLNDFVVRSGFHRESNTTLEIVREENTMRAKVLRNGHDITPSLSNSAFNWTRESGNAVSDAAWELSHAGMKSFALGADDLVNRVKISCRYTSTEDSYGSINSTLENGILNVNHSPSTADANDTFDVNENGELLVNRDAGVGAAYSLVDGELVVNVGFNGEITANAVYSTVKTREVDFEYNHNGLRSKKVVTESGVKTTTEYIYHGKLITHLIQTTERPDEEPTTEELHFFYDANSRPAFVEYNDVKYRYIHNLQGDIVAVVDTAGIPVVEYKYNAWGEPLATTGDLADTLSKLNPFRYRSYVYDEETGLYYVSSRYYDPEVGRWINADGQISSVGGDIRGYNLFAYCFNNPVNMIDPTGNWPSWGQVFAAVATVAVAAGFVAAVVASAGAVGVAAGVAAASIGATGTMVSAAITVGTVGTYAVAAGIGACALSNAGEILTGTNVIRDGLMGGNQEAYDTVQTALNIAGGGAMIIGQTNPGVTGNAAEPNQNAQSVHKVPTTGTANTSFDKLYAGKAGDFQRTYYDFRGNMSLQVDFTTHNNPSAHSNPHLHTFWLGKRQPQINLWYLE